MSSNAHLEDIGHPIDTVSANIAGVSDRYAPTACWFNQLIDKK